jgi:NTP pyrophosphatase (non-canonical NTP hydrolase)
VSLNGRHKSPSREEFVAGVAALAAEVHDFHARWGDGAGAPGPAAQVILERIALLKEEVRELIAEVDRPDDAVVPADVAEEASDVLFVAIGNLYRLGGVGIEAMERVLGKNAAKTEQTHYVNLQTKKITRRGR